MSMHIKAPALARVGLLISALIVAASAGAQVEGLKVGVVSVNRLLEQAPQFRSAMEALQEEFAPRQRELLAMQRSLQDKQETYERDGAIMAETERLSLEREIRDGQRDFQREQGDMNEDANIRQNEELSKLQRSLLQEVQAFARTAGYDLVVADALYFSTAIDITDDVLAALEASYTGSSDGP
jgi:outer membrane protein